MKKLSLLNYAILFWAPHAACVLCFFFLIGNMLLDLGAFTNSPSFGGKYCGTQPEATSAREP